MSENLSKAGRRIFAVLLIAVVGLKPASIRAERPDASGAAIVTAPYVRFEVLPIDSGAELLTLFFTDSLVDDDVDRQELPLISVLRDTLGSSDPSLHRLRYVWIHSNGSPGFKQRVAAIAPFLYGKMGNAGISEGKKPSPVLDLATPEDRLWKSIWGYVLKGALLDPRLAAVGSAVQRYEGNRTAYIQTQLTRASTAIDMDVSDFPVLSDAERRQLQQRFAQRNRDLAPLLNEERLERFYQKEMIAMREACARNWELLRQRVEAEGLYFEPLSLPDGTATHVLVWVSREDVEDRKRSFNDRFLSIGKPWGDKALLNWNGPTEVRFLDSENRRVRAETPGARRIELIPLALYGLDHPRIPALLVDFRKPFNAKARELSRRAVDALGDRLPAAPGVPNLVSRWGKTAGGFVARKMGMDVLQPSRLPSYSQLKLVLSTNPGLTPGMRTEIGRRIEAIIPNPFENDLQAEMDIATSHYKALIAYATEPNGLEQDLNRDRRAELRTSAHGGTAKFLFRLGSILTFARYTHRESDRPDLEYALEAQRRNLNHKRFIEAVLAAGPYLDVYWAPEKVRMAIRDAMDNRVLGNDAMARAAHQIFTNSHDEATRDLCLASLLQLNTPGARILYAHLTDGSPVDSSSLAAVAPETASPNDGNANE